LVSCGSVLENTNTMPKSRKLFSKNRSKHAKNVDDVRSRKSYDTHSYGDYTRSASIKTIEYGAARPIESILVQRASTEEPSTGETTASEIPESSNRKTTMTSSEREHKAWEDKLKNYEKHTKGHQPVEQQKMDADRKKEVRELLKKNLWRLAKEEITLRDPRNQILNFFNDVAQEGAQNVEQDGKIDADGLHPLLKTFNRASVFTVWRPTSMDANRKMICGEAVGKGLDIKGKSAKKGTLSGFVPFLQISENRDKSRVHNLTKDGRIRLFFYGEKNGEDARDVVKLKLRQVLREIQNEMKANPGDNGNMRASLKRFQMTDQVIRYIDDYIPARYGLDIPTRLFWEAFIQRQDITRKKGSIYDTGRASSPSFQDMNLATFNKPHKKGNPRPVLIQYADFLDTNSPMNPFELILAYESPEMSRVLPVVSDFDCFLVGTRRVMFKSALGPTEAKVLGWCIDECEKILANQKSGQIWTNLWCDVLQDAHGKGFNPKVPKFGFGDPKSYSIMENAVKRLNVSGAVMHGAECFNYMFPQDLDDKFLVIGPDKVPGKVPWKYVDENGLLDFLHDRVDDGYTFPMNPKWVLCDAGRWRDLYNKLMVNDNENTIDSMNVWYPRKGGIREKMRRITAMYPNGFDPEGGAQQGITIDPDEVQTHGLRAIAELPKGKPPALLSTGDGSMMAYDDLFDDVDEYTFPNRGHDKFDDRPVIRVKWLYDKYRSELPNDLQIVINYGLLFLLGLYTYHLCYNPVFFPHRYDYIGTKVGYYVEIEQCECGEIEEDSFFTQMYNSASYYWQY